MRTSTRLLAAAAASTILLTGCSAASPGDMASTPSVVEPASGSESGGGTPARAPAPVGDEAGRSVPYTTGVERQIARTASMTVVVDDVQATAERIRALAATLDGWVSNESLGLIPDEARTTWQPAGSWITLSVPASRLDEAIGQVGEFGTVRNRQASAEDVTDMVVDLDARITSLEASVARLQELVGRAGSVADIAAVERELSSRQAELEAMKSQRLHLAGAVERSTLTVALLTPTESTTTNPLQTGWSRGWAAFLESVALVITLVGALLPFVVLAALIGLPVVLLLRRRRAQRATRSTASGNSPGGAAGGGTSEQERPHDQTEGEDDPQSRPE